MLTKPHITHVITRIVKADFFRSYFILYGNIKLCNRLIINFIQKHYIIS